MFGSCGRITPVLWRNRASCRIWRSIRPVHVGKTLHIQNTLLSRLATNTTLTPLPIKDNDAKRKSNTTIEDDDTPIDFMNKLPEQLISEGNGFKHTTAENQLDTSYYYNMLRQSGFNPEQCHLIISLLLEVLNDEFFDTYNYRFLRSIELDNQSHLFHAAETELKYAIQNLRGTQLNDQHLQIMKLIRDLDSLHDEIHEMIINFLEKDSKVDFNNQKIENTLLHRKITLDLSDCQNKVGTKILGNTKSEIENLRWQTTRSGLLAILILVFFIMTGVNISRKLSAENDKPMEVILHTREEEEFKDDDQNCG